MRLEINLMTWCMLTNCFPNEKSFLGCGKCLKNENAKYSESEINGSDKYASK